MSSLTAASPVAQSPVPQSPLRTPGRSSVRCAPLEIELDIYSSLTPPAHRMIRSVDAYTIERKVGEGTYGAVYLAVDAETGRKVALKKIKLNDAASEKEGLTITTLREINHLFKVKHANVVQLIEVVFGAFLGCRDNTALLCEGLAVHEVPLCAPGLAIGAQSCCVRPLCWLRIDLHRQSSA